MVGIIYSCIILVCILSQILILLIVFAEALNTIAFMVLYDILC